jgi:transposase
VSLVQPIPKGISTSKCVTPWERFDPDESFAHLFPQNGRPVEAPWRLALITIIQFMEDLPDRQAADAVRGRIDLKYVLGLELTDPGFDFTLLSD